MPKFLVIFLVLDWVSLSVHSQVRVPIPVLWMVPGQDSTLVSGPDPALVLALNLALEDLKKHPGLNLELQLHRLQGQCDLAVVLQSLFEVKGAGLEAQVILGGVCPSVTSLISPALPVLHLVQVSFLAPPPPHVHRKCLGHMISTVPSDWALNRALVKLLQTLDWTLVGLVSEKTPRISQSVSDLVSHLDRAQIQVVASVRFKPDSCSSLQQLKDRDVRIFVGLFEEDSASKLFCCVFRLSLFGPQFQWLLLGAGGGASLGWSRSLCSTQSLLSAAQGSIQVQVPGLSLNQDPGVSGRTAEEYERLYLQRLSSSGLKLAPLHGFVYDAVWLLALALNRTLDHNQDRTQDRTQDQTQDQTMDPNKTLDTPRDPELRPEKLLQVLKTMDFNGVTGPVQFHGGERMSILEFSQFQGSSSVVIGLYNMTNENLTLHLHRVKGGPLPRGRTEVWTQTDHVNLALYIVMATASSIIILLSLIFIFLCVLNRRHRLDLWRCVEQEELLSLGVVLCCVSVLVLGLDQVSVSDQTWTVLCSVQVWTLSLGHSVVFSVFFTEAWARYSTTFHLPKSHLQSSWRLLLWLLVLDVFVLSSWSLMDPLSRVETERHLKEQSDGGAVVIISYRCGCSSSELWITAICSYKGPLLGLGLFVVWNLGSGSSLVVISLKSGLSGLSLSSAAMVLAYTCHDASLRYSLSSAFVLIGCLCVLGSAFGPKLFVPGPESSPQTEEEEEQRRRNRELRTRSLHLELEIDRLRREIFHQNKNSEKTRDRESIRESTPYSEAEGEERLESTGEEGVSLEEGDHIIITFPKQGCGRVAVQLPILHHGYLPAVGGVSPSSSHASMH